MDVIREFKIVYVSMQHSTPKISSLLATTVLICGVWYAIFAGIVFMMSSGKSYSVTTQLIFRLDETSSPLHPEFVEPVIAQSKTPDRSIVSAWNIRNAIKMDPAIRKMTSFDGLSTDEIVAEFKERLELRLDEPKEDFHKVILFSANDDNGTRILETLYDSYIDLMEEEEIRCWSQRITELEKSIEFFKKVLNGSQMESSLTTREMAETSLAKDEDEIRALRVGFDERVSSMEFAKLDLSKADPEPRLGRLILSIGVVFLLPIAIVSLVVIVSRSQAKGNSHEPGDVGAPPRRRRWKLSARQIILPVALALLGALTPVLMAAPSYSSTCRLRIIAQKAPGATPLESFQNLLDIQRRVPFKEATIGQFISRHKWVTTLDQYSQLPEDHEDPDNPLKRLLTDSLEWKEDELGAGFFDLKFTSDNSAESQMLLEVLTKCFKESYEGILDVNYVSTPSESEKNWTFRKNAMIICAVLGLILGVLATSILGAHRTILASQQRISLATESRETEEENDLPDQESMQSVK